MLLIVLAAGVLVLALLLFGAACRIAGFVFAALLRPYLNRKKTNVPNANDSNTH